jgi:Spy/CpxP family protein refolding chaperone
MTMKRSLAALCGFAVVFATSLLATAQEPKRSRPAEGSAPPTAKRPYDSSRRVPDHFGQISLTAEQRESMYKIRGKYQDKIDSLEKQVQEVRAQVLSECEALLTDTQKQLLEHRRKAAAEGRKARASSKPQVKSVKATN